MLRAATDAVESISPEDPQSIVIGLASLSGLICDLWRSANDSGPYHREILAALDTAVITAINRGTVMPRQLSAFRQALSDLSLKTLTESNVSSLASYFIDEGFSPLAPLGGLDLSDDAAA